MMILLIDMVDLGVAQACLGNVLWWVFGKIGGVITREEEAMQQIMTYLKDAANDLGHEMPVSKLKLTHIRGTDLRPRLKAKAARTRRLVPIALRMLSMHFVPESEQESRIFKRLEYLNTAYQELEHWTPTSAVRLEEAVRRHCLLYLSLARESQQHDDRFLLWRWYPKHHMVLHLAGEQAHTMGNPASWWC